MLKNLVQLEHIVADKVCRFICENDTDINIIKEALFQFQKFIGSVEDIAKANKEAIDKENQPAPIDVPVDVSVDVPVDVAVVEPIAIPEPVLVDEVVSQNPQE